MNFITSMKICRNRIERFLIVQLILGTVTEAGNNNLRDAAARQNVVYGIDQNPNEGANVNTIVDMGTR